jgi:hypothetical protein
MTTHQVAGEDDLGALPEEELDGGDGGTDAGVVGDLLGVVERHVEVGADEHLLPLQIRLPEGAHAPLGRHPCAKKPKQTPAMRRMGRRNRRTGWSEATADRQGRRLTGSKAAAVRTRRGDLRWW